jgi:hypothetical protein
MNMHRSNSAAHTQRARKCALWSHVRRWDVAGMFDFTAIAYMVAISYV